MYYFVPVAAGRVNRDFKLVTADGLDTTGFFGAVFDGRYVWAVTASADAVAKIDTATGTVVGTFPVGSAPIGLAFDGRNVWVTNAGDGTVSRL